MPLHNLINFVVVVVVPPSSADVSLFRVQFCSVSARGCLFYFVVVLMHFNIVSKFHCRLLLLLLQLLYRSCWQLSFSYKWVYVSFSLHVCLCAFINCISRANLCQIVAFDFIIILSIRCQRICQLSLLLHAKLCKSLCSNLLHTHTQTHTERQQDKAYQIFRSICKMMLGN